MARRAAIEKKIRSLLSLLDDEDERVAISAMAELLALEPELGIRLAELQESPDELVRRRCHQLQAALTLRRRRRDFFQHLYSPQINVANSLIEVHLLWYDNDSRPELERMWECFMETARKFPFDTLPDVACFFRQNHFQSQPESTLHPEYCCLGMMLENHIGCSALLCAVILAATVRPEEFRIARLIGEFALQDRSGALLLPQHDWQVIAGHDAGPTEFWDVRQLLRYLAITLFSSAVNSDSFRYVLTIAQALYGTNDDGILDYFPYPYRPSAEAEEADQDN